MIELTDAQIESLDVSSSSPPRAIHTRTNQQFVLLSVEEYDRLTSVDYDDSPWTRTELEALAWEAGRSVGWDDVDEYDNLPQKP